MLEPTPAALARQVILDEGLAVGPEGWALLEEFEASGVSFTSPDPKLTRQYARALAHLALCALRSPTGTPMLIEGGVYHGCWLESTGTINTEILSRFCPGLAASTFSLFAEHRRADGLIPYKITPSGAAFRQIQMVTPLARSVWNHAASLGWVTGSGIDPARRPWVETLYEAMAAHDGWLAAHRDTRGTGGVEAFCAFDTGHDLSPRFWHGGDTCYGSDPTRPDPDDPLLPYLAPDLTANVACQRLSLARLARALGREGEAAAWEAKAAASTRVVLEDCWDPEDRFFYDRDRHGRFVRLRSDVLLRVLACEIGDDRLFAGALESDLLNTRRFFSRCPFPSLAMDDPRFDPSSAYNTWAGATNVLSVIRAFHAFEAHGRYAEQYLAARPLVAAFYRMERFGQCLNPWTGEEGYTQSYSPAMLGLLDFTERFSGILPTPDRALWFTSLPPRTDDHGASPSDASEYRRTVDGLRFLWTNAPGTSSASADGRFLFSVPRGLRVETDRSGRVTALVGLVPRTVTGTVALGDRSFAVAVGPNQRWLLDAGGFRLTRDPGMVLPR